MADEIRVELERAEDEQLELDELIEALATVQLVSEERHTELVERIETCQAELSRLSGQLQAIPQEQPVLNQLAVTLAEIRAEQTKICAELENLKSSLSRPSTSTEMPERTITEEIPDLPNPVESTEEPALEEPVVATAPPKRRRVNIL